MGSYRRRVQTALHVAKSALSAAGRRGRDPVGAELAKELRARRLTFLETEALLDLRLRCQELDGAAVPGVFLEAGCALGGSAIMLTAAKKQARRLEVYDVFGMIPPPTERDGEDVQSRYATIAAGGAEGFDGDVYYGYQPELMQQVEKHFAEFGYPCEPNNVILIEGLFQDTIQPSGPVALAHIDGDWYESVKVCLDRIWPVLSVGGVMVIDDYDAWSGCRTAVDEFIGSTPGVVVGRRARLHLTRKGNSA